MNRRSFLKKATLGLAGIAAAERVAPFLPGLRTGQALAADAADLGVVKGSDFFKSTQKAVELLGGMAKFTPKDCTVGLLINSPFKNRGAHTNPDIVLAVAEMCFQAGAKAVIPLKGESRGYWNRGKLADQMKDLIKELSQPKKGRTKVQIPNGVALKKAEISKDLLECDVYINIPIAKHHEGTGYTGALKNLMGAAPYSTNKFFHHGSGGSGWYDDVRHLSQCIADFNTVRTPDLTVCDATKFILTNGPWGPGRMAAPRKVVASADAVALDAYCCALLGLKAAETDMITMARDHGLGNLDLKSMQVREIEA